MQLDFIKIDQFRGLASTELSFSPRLNLISGSNAAGKTSLLEAIYFLSRGKSFRNTHSASLMQYGKNSFGLFGRFFNSMTGISTPVGFQKTGAQLEAKLNGNRLEQLSQLASLLPLQVISPDSHRLLEEGPEIRRKFLDWGVFHVEPEYLGHCKNYYTALKQRNAALRAKCSMKEVESWLEPLAFEGEAINAAREGYLRQLSEVALEIQEQLAFPEENLSFLLKRGWNAQSNSLADCLQEQTQLDFHQGFTGSGPHRADLTLLIGDRKAKEHISRGQQKIVAAILLLAQVRLVWQIKQKAPILIIDDLTAELDGLRAQKFLELLGDLPIQLFISTIQPESLDLSQWSDKKLFHVEHGSIKEVVQ